MEVSLDKSEWSKVNFGDVVKKVNNKINPEGYHSDFVVEGGHINKRDFHIRSYVNKKELGYLGPAFHMGFKKGQILYVSRNPHLMKVGYPHFDGICANTTFIMETKDEEKLRNDLIPFIMHSDTFIEQSVGNVRGGVNPYMNWGDLASIEFLLPSKDHQARLAELLWAGDRLIETYNLLTQKLNQFLLSSRENLIYSNVYKFVPLQELCKKKISYGIVQAGPNILGGMPYIKSSDLSENGIKLDQLEATSDQIAKKYIRSEVEPGDIVFSLRGNLGSVNLVPKELKKANLTQGTARISPNDDVFNGYLMYAIETLKVQKAISAISKGSTFKEISLEALRNIKIPIPKEHSVQKSIYASITNVKDSLRCLQSCLSHLKQLQKSLINQIF
jgi:type I restriction enzyme, S subunit